jgi:hypothetical protein
MRKRYIILKNNNNSIIVVDANRIAAVFLILSLELANIANAVWATIAKLNIICYKNKKL